MLTLLLLVITATWYQAKLNQLQFTAPHISAISAKIDAVMAATAAGGIVTLDAGAAGTYTSNVSNSGSLKSTRGHQAPAFEVYQMSTLNDNNNVPDIEADVNGNKTVNNGTNAGHVNGHSNGSAAAAATTNGAGGSGSSNSSSVRRPHGELSASEVRKSHLADYRLETGSNVGASSTYEAKRQLSKYICMFVCIEGLAHRSLKFAIKMFCLCIAGLHEQLLLCFAFQTNAGTILNMTENKEVS